MRFCLDLEIELHFFFLADFFLVLFSFFIFFLSIWVTLIPVIAVYFIIQH